MISLKKHNRHIFFQENFFKWFLSLLFVIIVILIFSLFFSTRSWLKDTFSFFFSSGDDVYKGISWVPSFFSDKNKLISENKIISEKLENMKSSLIDYEIIKSENQKLREILNIKPTGKFLTAFITARPPQIPLDSLFINIGTSDGIKNGDLILVGERILIGKISEVSNHKSTVVLNSLAGAVSYGFIERTDEHLEIKGVGGGNLEAKVSIDFDVKVGDKIIIADSAEYFLAFVGVVEEDKSSGFKNVLMYLPADISKLNMVFVKSQSNE